MNGANTPLSVIRRLFFWVGYIARSRVLFSLIAIGVAIYGVVLRCSSLGRSLWLDEAWVANSVSAHSLGGMFYYETFLQTCPPLFLVLVRLVVAVFGLSNTVLRAVPSFMGTLAVLLMLLFVLRILWRQYALLAWVLLVLSPLAVNYSRELKAFSSELAATTAILLACALYIENANTRRFWLLVTAASVGLLCGYAVALLLPGIALLIWISPVRQVTPTYFRINLSNPFARVVLFSAIAGGILIGEYCLFVIPNSPAVLHKAWAKKNSEHVQSFASLVGSESYRFIGELPLNHRFERQEFRLASVGFAIIVGLALAWLRFRKGRHRWLAIQIVCLLPCLLLIISDRFNWYPFTERTSLFALPCLIALLISNFQLMSLFLLRKHRDWIRPVLDLLVLGAIAITLIAGRSKNYRYLSPVEDVDGAVSFLHAQVQPQDLLWVHSSCWEAFKLYARMDKWKDAPARYGQTGWPCCARGINETKDTSSEALVRNDFGKALGNFSGRVWLLYTTRPEHWRGFADEPKIMRTILQEKGCRESPTPPPAFINIGVAAYDCEQVPLPPVPKAQ